VFILESGGKGSDAPQLGKDEVQVSALPSFAVLPLFRLYFTENYMWHPQVYCFYVVLCRNKCIRSPDVSRYIGHGIGKESAVFENINAKSDVLNCIPDLVLSFPISPSISESLFPTTLERNVTQV